MWVINLILWIVATAALGVRLIRWLDREEKLTVGERIIVGMVSSFAVLGFAALALALITKNLSLGAYWAAFFSIAFNGKILFKNIRQRARTIINGLRPRRTTIWALGFLLFLFLGILLQTVIIDNRGFPQSTIIGWGDIGYHLDMIGTLARDGQFTLEQPIANGATLTYPFFINFYSALFVKLGFPLWYAWYIPSLVFGVAAIFLLYFLGLRLLRHKQLAAALVFLVLVGGGIGFVWFFKDVQQGYHTGGLSGIIDTITDPPHEYTHLDNRTGGKLKPNSDTTHNIVWIAPAISFFSHQRSFVIGCSLILLVLLGWIIGEQNKDRSPPSYSARWLPFLGLLPLSHSHSAMAAALLFLALYVYKICTDRSKLLYWTMGGIAAVVIALPQILYLSRAGFAGSGIGHDFFRPWFGWMTCTHPRSWFWCDSRVAGTDSSVFWFWTKNFGIIFWGWLAALPVLIVFRRTVPKMILALIAPSILLFAVPNLLLLQPWEFDNGKMLLYWWILALVLIFAVIRILYHEISKPYVHALVIAFVVIGGFAGTIDASTRIKQTAQAILGVPYSAHAGYYNEQELSAAQWIKQNTKPTDAFLSSDGANNFIPMLTGRPLFLGFSGWLWTQGRGEDAGKRKQMAGKFFESKDPSELCSAGVRWVMWEPWIINVYPTAKNVDSSTLGASMFSQDLGGQKRIIIRLLCSS